MTDEHRLLLLSKIPQELHEFISDIHDPPAFGNCGFYAIAAALGNTKEDACFYVREQLQQEYQDYPEDHRFFVTQESELERSAKCKDRGIEKPKTSEKLMKEIIDSLDCKYLACGRSKWLRTPHTGRAIASVFGRPFICIDTSDFPNLGSHSFFPYRSSPWMGSTKALLVPIVP